ncbi:glycosyltransferase family 8 protein [Devosia sp. XJ19-1]|uniref:Glycosyltransferase family 8 protein n=1 Tax=Devosia ureilytica TaxID=2952754 RepID=A0A9Q4FRQ3_9HYPH|nr:glycosyltransferase family 8 protein [Devosia ureilytica]MCP8883170.1 glycosyltransferase family 8 protein [Devosia ureilytica]MCP8886462.1 glycosyltransferase family 8 protein [Devosia ureilytica]
MNKSLHIALTFDDNFWAPAYAVMRSICLSTRRRGEIVFYLLHMPLSAEHRADLARITEEFGAALVFYPLVGEPFFEDFVAGLPQGGRWPKVVYARMLLPGLLPQEVERVIYLDCDMLVRAPIEELYDIDLAGKPLGAVRDALAPFIPMRRDMIQNADLFDGADPYFNSGMLVIDLDLWRQMDLRAEIDALAKRGILAKLYFDQDLLNLIFRDKWQALPWRWNTIDAHEAHEALDPAILHFTKPAKPWGIFAGILRSTAYARWYRHVMTNALFYRFARHRWKRWWLKRLRLT